MKLNSKKQKRLEAAGWHVGSIEDFLGLSQKELEYIDLKVTQVKLLSIEAKK
ncbi:MAG: hypothetical protein ACO36I_14390 [Candidatus Latescibacterota bacterium]|jgi:hypothetical protein